MITIRPTTKRLELLVDLLNSDHLFRGETRVARNNSIAVFKNDEELSSICIDDMLDSQIIDLCNIIVTVRDCVEDNFKFVLHAPDSAGSIFFKELQSSNDGSLCLQVSKFPDLIYLSYQRRSSERVSIDSSFRFDSLEQLSEETFKFLDRINELD